MKKLTLTVLFLTLATAPVAFSQATAERAGTDRKADASAAGSKLAQRDETFLKTAAQDGMAEVALGKLAQEKGESQHVKEFGAMMVKDHSAANEELKALAASKGVQLATELDSKRQALVDKLSKLSGAEFDKAYMQQMAKEHKKDVSAFESAAKNCKDPDVKAFAEKNLPVLKEHLEHAKMSKGDKKSS